MAPPQPQSPTQDAQSVEQLIYSFIEMIQRLVQTMPSQLKASICAMFAFQFIADENIATRNENIEKVIYWFRKALVICTRESNPEEWATLQYLLGHTLQHRISRDRCVNIDEGIKCYRLALEIWTRESMPQDWAMTQNHMGNALQDRISGDRGVNIDEAIECYRLALEIETREAMPQEWATTQMNMGNALQDRISGDRGVNIDEAIECYRLALEIWTREAMPQDWATTQMNMGSALLERISGDRRANIDEAIECYGLALEIWTRESMPQHWATTQMNMGNALQDRISGDERVNIDEAIECYRLAFEIWTREAMPQDWAKTQMNMGNALLDRISGDRGVNIDEAIECYRLALDIMTRESMPRHWAGIQLNMGRAYLSHAEEGRTGNMHNAKFALKNFFQAISLQMDPLTFLKGCSLHTNVYLRIGSITDIIASCEQGLHAVEYAKSLSSAGLLHSRHLDEEYSSFAINLMSLYFHEEQYEKVLEVFDRNKASLLLSLISEWDDAGSKLSEEDRTKLEELKADYRGLKYELDLKSGKGKEYKNVMEEFIKTKTSIDSLIKMDDQDRKQNVVGVSYEEMNEFVKKKNVIAIVFFFAGEYEKLKEGDNSKSLHAICMWNGRVTGYVGEELKYERSYETAKMFSENGLLPSESIQERVKRRKDEEEFLMKLGKFMSSILDDLTNNPESDLPNRLMIVPHYTLNKVPFCAVPVRTGFDGYTGDERRFLGDVFQGGIWMVPSMSIGARIDKKKERENAKKLADCKVVSATCPSVILREQYNKTVREEIGGKVKSHVHISDPYPPRTKIKMSEDLRDCDMLHLTCHGVFAGGRDVWRAIRNPSEVLSGSALLFESSEKKLISKEERELKKLNMVDIWGLNLKECNLVNVVACSGGAVNALSNSDESLSVGTGFLVGGARNVICCAWPVQEIVAAIMMGRLLENMCKSGNGENGVWKIGEHLGEVQRWFRSLTDEECNDLRKRYDPDMKTNRLRYIDDPYHWGAFMLVGPPD